MRSAHREIDRILNDVVDGSRRVLYDLMQNEMMGCPFTQIRYHTQAGKNPTPPTEDQGPVLRVGELYIPMGVPESPREEYVDMLSTSPYLALSDGFHWPALLGLRRRWAN